MTSEISIEKILNIIPKNNIHLFNTFFENELDKENSDYYIGEYSSGPFTDYPTRVFYGLFIQWEHLADWENDYIKKHTKPNKTKFKYLIRKDKKHLLEPLSDRMGTKLVQLINCLKNIVNVDTINVDLNQYEKYALRSFYLYKYIHETSGDITKNVAGHSFFKKSIKDGEVIQKDGTILSIIYDTYNDAVNPIEKRIRKPKQKKPVLNITNTAQFPPLTI
jgi:hypothetical protein